MTAWELDQHFRELDQHFRTLGYFLHRPPPGTWDEYQWEVCNIDTLAVAWKCANLREVQSLLRAVQERQARGGREYAIVYWDWERHAWACADKPSSDPVS